MGKYDKLMQEIIAYLDGTWLSKPHPLRHPDKEPIPITGASEQEIEEAEAKIGKKIPAALKAWYRVAGKTPTYLYDHDADYTICDLMKSQESAQWLSDDDRTAWTLVDKIIPYSSRLGDQLLYLDCSKDNNQDDPPVIIISHTKEAKFVSVAFSVSMRETWLSWLEFAAKSHNRSQEFAQSRTQKKGSWSERQKFIRDLRNEAKPLRNELVEQIYQEDLKRDEITGPMVFQKRWIEVFDSSEIKKKFDEAEAMYPYYWVEAPKVFP